MAENNIPMVEERVIITIDSDRFSDTTIEYAVSVAAQLKRPLHGVFIEDTDLLSSAALPFTREICFATGLPRHFDTSSLQSAFADTAARFQQRLAQRAEKMSVRWSVSSVRGRRRDFAFDTLTPTDYCIYEAGKPIKKTKKWERQLTAVKHLLVIDGSGPEFYRTLATLLTPLQNHEVHISLVQSSTDEPMTEGISLLPAGVHIHPIGKSQLYGMLQQPDINFDYVIISRQHWSAELTPLLSTLSCPLIVVG